MYFYIWRRPHLYKKTFPFFYLNKRLSRAKIPMPYNHTMPSGLIIMFPCLHLQHQFFIFFVLIELLLRLLLLWDKKIELRRWNYAQCFLFSNDKTGRGTNKQHQDGASSHFPRHLSSLSLVQNIAVDFWFVNSDSKNPRAPIIFPQLIAELRTKQSLAALHSNYLRTSSEKTLQWTWSRF